MNSKKVTQQKLHSMMNRNTVLRVGATNDVARRSGEYHRESAHAYHSGRTMYYASTDNMKMAENKLLDRGSKAGCSRNEQHSSNAQADKGFVYVIR